MAIRYKPGIMEALKNIGYSSTKLRKERIFGEKTMQDFRTQATIPYKSIDKLCAMLDCQPGDVIEYVCDESEKSQSPS